MDAPLSIRTVRSTVMSPEFTSISWGVVADPLQT